MFAVVVNHKIIDYIENFIYIKYNRDNDSYIECNEEEAEGYYACDKQLALNFPNSRRLINGKEAELIEVADIGNFIYVLEKENNELKERVALLNRSLIETIKMFEDKISVLENNIIELSEENIKE